MSASFTPGPWMLVPPGGPQGPFWGLMNSKGNVVALQIVNGADARVMSVAPELLEVLRGVLANAGSHIDTEWLERAANCIADADPLKQARPDRETEVGAGKRWQGVGFTAEQT